MKIPTTANTADLQTIVDLKQAGFSPEYIDTIQWVSSCSGDSFQKLADTEIKKGNKK